MPEKRNKESKLTRISLGGLSQIPGFAGDKNDYTRIGRVTFKGKRNGQSIRLVGLGMENRQTIDTCTYDPKNTDDFLAAINTLLKQRSSYLTYANHTDECWPVNQQVHGNLLCYSKQQPETSELEQP